MRAAVRTVRGMPGILSEAEVSEMQEMIKKLSREIKEKDPNSDIINTHLSKVWKDEHKSRRL